jgi:hypothetical protein
VVPKKNASATMMSGARRSIARRRVLACAGIVSMKRRSKLNLSMRSARREQLLDPAEVEIGARREWDRPRASRLDQRREMRNGCEQGFASPPRPLCGRSTKGDSRDRRRGE